MRFPDTPFSLTLELRRREDVDVVQGGVALEFEGDHAYLVQILLADYGTTFLTQLPIDETTRIAQGLFLRLES